MAKSFKEKANRPSVYATIRGVDTEVKEVSEVQEVQKVQEVQEVLNVQQVDLAKRQESLNTQGKKGAKAQRFNMAFTPSNLKFIRIMSKLKGQTMTQFVNEVIDKERNLQDQLYKKVKSLSDTYIGGQ